MRIGILGGGQLGQMMAQAARPLGIDVTCFDTNPDACAKSDAELFVSDPADTDALANWADSLDFLTYEFENFDVDFVSRLAEIRKVDPSIKALATAQDRWAEKGLFDSLDIAVPPFRTVRNEVELRAAVRDLNFPLVVKTRRGGYDGKGQVVVRSEADVASALRLIDENGVIAESFVDFDFELSIVAVRSSDGSVRTYAPAVNQHVDGILHISLVDPDLQPSVVETARKHIAKVLTELEYVGVACIEFFVQGNKVLANEMAPRVHNSGHWTIEGAETSQFENHLRAISGLPLGSVATVGPVAMVNIVGTAPSLEQLLEILGASVHLYGKEPRPGRKLGHVTVMGAHSEELALRVTRVADLLKR